MAMGGVTGFRAMYLTTIMEQIHRVEMLKALISQIPVQEHVRIYRENLLISRIIYDFEFRANRAGFVALFVAILLAANGIILALTQKRVLVAIIAALFAFAVTIVLQIAFTVGCIFFIASGNILQKWRRNTDVAANKRKKTELFKVLNSMRRISVPAGGAGIVDREMILTFWDKLLGDLIDSSILYESV